MVVPEGAEGEKTLEQEGPEGEPIVVVLEGAESEVIVIPEQGADDKTIVVQEGPEGCLLYTSPSPRD